MVMDRARLILWSSLGVLLWNSHALADGMPKSTTSDPYAYTPDVVAPEYNWSGFFIGGHIGGAHSETSWTFTPPTEAVEQSATAFASGAQAGLQWQWSNF